MASMRVRGVVAAVLVAVCVPVAVAHADNPPPVAGPVVVLTPEQVPAWCGPNMVLQWWPQPWGVVATCMTPAVAGVPATSNDVPYFVAGVEVARIPKWVALATGL